MGEAGKLKMILAKENILQDIARIIIWYPFRWLTRILPPGSISLFLK